VPASTPTPEGAFMSSRARMAAFRFAVMAVVVAGVVIGALW
jgi:hypothetical protein